MSGISSNDTSAPTTILCFSLRTFQQHCFLFLEAEPLPTVTPSSEPLTEISFADLEADEKTGACKGSFSRAVWTEVLQMSSGKNKWDQRTLMDCFHSWIVDKSEKSFRTLPCYVVWGIWLSRIKMIFQGLELSPAHMAHKIRCACKGSWESIKEKSARILKEPVIDFGKAWGFFDGAFQGASWLCGAGVIFFS